MGSVKHLDSVLQSLEERLSRLECDSSTNLGYAWATIDGAHKKEKWVFNNWAELIQNFKLDYPDDDVSGSVQIPVMEPITAEKEYRFVTRSFADWVNDQYKKCNARKERKRDQKYDEEQTRDWTSNKGRKKY